jgi:hypothetical protein
MTLLQTLLTAVSLVALLLQHCEAFIMRPVLVPSSPRVTLLMGALDQLPGESDRDFMKRVMSVASDATTFENAVMERSTVEQEPKHTPHGRFQPGNHPHNDPPSKTKKAYQRVEEWDKEQKESLTWEEKVQFDGQRYGNKVNQNDILRHHLHTF